ncbi:MAG: hypothetical protein PHW75_00540 [Patescibacteria group bacterium]|nr:hypothetical protein [Patescibacteria group bacterium]
MKIYSIIVTIVAVIAILAAGFLGYQYQDLQKQKKAVEDDMNEVQQELEGARLSVTNLETTVVALESTVGSFQPVGDTTIGSFIPVRATESRQKIEEITDEKDREIVLEGWDLFYESRRLNDFQHLLEKFTETLGRSLDNI